jgi:phosphatidate cytidylyltransferase
MARVLSGAVLAAVAVGVVWFAPGWLFFAVAELLLMLAFAEYARLASAAGFDVPRGAAGAATVAASVGVSATRWVEGGVDATAILLDAVLMSAFVVLASITLATWKGERDAAGRLGAALLPLLYIGLPIGALVSIRALHGREALFLLMLTIMVSDTAQYYTGRALGRRLLAPAISPKKTIEGAAGGFVAGVVLMTIVGNWWLPAAPLLLRAALGLTVVALGIAGDLFESVLKRSAGVKDSASLIPGHGGVLDRIDALLFAAPVYYVVLKYV